MTTVKGAAAPRLNWLWTVWKGCQPLLLGGIGLGLAMGIPPQGARWLGGWLRYGLDLGLIFFLLAVFLVALRFEMTLLHGVLAGVLSFLFGLVLVGLWTNVYSEIQVVSGGLFFSDAHQYYADSLRLLNGFPMSSFSARHPLPTLFQSGMLILMGGNLQLYLSGMAGLLGISLYGAAKVVHHQDGLGAAAVYLWMLFLFSRRFIGYPNAESLGILLSALAVAWLWRGVSESSLRMFWLGFFGLTLALLARPGPVGMIPSVLAIQIPSSKMHLGGVLRRLLPGVCVILAVLLVNLWTIWVLAEERSRLFSNYAEIFYGLTHGGKGWEQFSEDYPELLSQPELLREALAFQSAVDTLKSDPSLFLQGIALSYRDFFSIRDESAFGFLAGGEITSFNLPAEPHQKWFWGCLRLVVSVFSLIGLIALWKNRLQPSARLWIFSLTGLVSSIALLPPKDAGIMRMFAVALPFLARLPVLGIAWLQKRSQEGRQALPDAGNLTVFSGLVFGILAFSLTWLVFDSKMTLPSASLSCAAGAESIVIQIYPGSYVRLRETSEVSYSRLPDVVIYDFQSSLKNFFRQDLAEGLLQITAGHAVLSSINLHNGQSLWAILPAAYLPPRPDGQTLYACGRWDPWLLQRGFGFLYIEEAKPEK